MSDHDNPDNLKPELTIIGILRSDIKSLDEAPKGYGESERTGTLEIFPEFADGLDGVMPGQTITVLFWLHRSARDVLKVHPRGKKENRLRGVFSTRSPVRPNPIGISDLEVMAVDGNRIQVKKLDMLDQTPILDIKKKI
ncbi:MAG: tRNA (N6-threonylcarbamoyladenosine(37)-N6)-methyltransferase TrmO [Desulfofustis sp.]|jgi:tRNA (adenine37-N6)-methyltransferase